MGSYSRESPKRAWIETPLIESSVLSRAAGCRIFLKLENLQPSGSFKLRGLGNLVQQNFIQAQQSPNFDPEQLHFFSSSGGNAGLACVTAANTFGVKSTVVVPLSTPQSMVIKIKAAGATEVIIHGEAWANADQYLREVVVPAARSKGEKPIYAHPFSDPLLWDGYALMINEIKNQLPDNSHPDAIVCSVGGGGLFSGIMLGLDQEGWEDKVQVLACETVGADCLSQALNAGAPVTLPGITSFAKSLGASQIDKKAFKYGQRPNVQSLVFDDSVAAEGCWRFADDERILVEPACGVSVALAYRGRLRKLVKGFNSNSKVVIVVCGGSVVSLADLARWRDTYADQLPDEDEGTVKVPSNVES